MPQKMLTIGRIVKPWGLAGEVVVQPETDWPTRFSTLKQVLWGDKLVKADVERISQKGDRLLLKLSHVDTRNDSELLAGQWLYIPADQAMPLSKGEYFIHDILGLTTYSTEGVELGTVIEVMTGPANDVWVIRKEKEEILIPVIEDVVREVDLAARRITVLLPQGLVE
jgi:16S rRNA processing protein RimM